MKPRTLAELFEMDPEAIDFTGEGNLYDLNEQIGFPQPWAPPCPLVWRFKDNPDACSATKGERTLWWEMLSTLRALEDEHKRSQTCVTNQ